MPRPRIAVTIGDPAGIGPEVCCRAVAEPQMRDLCEPVVFGSAAIIQRVCASLGCAPPPTIVDVGGDAARTVEPGRWSAASGACAGAAIDAAISAVQRGDCAAIVTGPISKQAIQAAGYPFPGHTEWLAERTGVRGETMLMYAEDLAVALATCHLPLMQVTSVLTPQRIVDTARLLYEALRRLRGIQRPRLAVCGFNPHAGEDGLFGDEDRRLVAPAVYELLQLGIDCDGPLPPDTAFTPANRQRYDGHVALFHDQGLIPFKALHFDTGVNVTLGLPIVRTSVDHGTAWDIAWQGVAQHRSLVEAIRLATRLVTA